VRRALVLLLLLFLLAGPGLGCGGHKQRDINKDRDMPKPAEKNE